MDKAGLLALIAQQNSDLVAAVNALPDVSVDPLQAQLDAANLKIASLEAQLAKVSADAQVLVADAASQA